MIKIDVGTCEFQYPVDSDIKRTMHTISPQSFVLASITADVKTLISAIDYKYGKGKALTTITLALSSVYTREDLDQVDKEINGNE